jgi:hypothetical protein
MTPRWTPGIGDPGVVGWLTVVAYAGTAIACLLAAGAGAGAGESRRESRWFWVGSAIVLTLLGINKQLDLQSLLTQVGRDMARAEGWYEQRRTIQAAFICLVGFVGIVGLILAQRLSRSRDRAQTIALCGMVFLFVFIVVRAASFHHVDVALNHLRAFGKLNWLLELGGIATVLLGALVRWRNVHRRRQVA